MKMLKPSYGNIFFIYIPVVGSGILAGLYLGASLTTGIKYLGIIACILCLLFPFIKNKTHSITHKKIGRTSFLGFQIGFLLMSWMIIQALHQALPSISPASITTLFYPWPYALLLAALFSQQPLSANNPLIPQVLRYFFKGARSTTFIDIIDQSIRQGFFLSLCTTLSIILVNLSFPLQHTFHLSQVSGLRFNTLLYCVFIYLALGLTPWKSGIYKLWQRDYTLSRFLLILLFLIFISYLIFNLFNMALLSHISFPPLPLFKLPNIPQHSDFFIFAWMIGWLPLLLFYTIQYVKNHAWYDTFFSTLLLPGSLVIINYINPRLINSIFVFSNQWPIMIALSIISLIFILITFKDTIITSLFAYSETKGHLSLTTIYGLLPLVFATFFIYLLTGFSLLSLLLFSSALSTLVGIYLIILTLFRKKVA